MTPPGKMEAIKARDAPRLAIAAAAFLVVLKGAGAWITGSLALGSAALDSLIDVFVSAANWVVLRRSAAPPDADHAYGHGKFENLAALGQGLFLAGGAVTLVLSAVKRLGSGEPPRETGVGILILMVSLGVSYLVARHLRRAARAADSPALEADSVHYASDLWVNGAAAAALVVIAATGWAPADPLVALGVALYVFRTAATLILESLGVLSDRALPADELRRIQEVVGSFRERGVLGMHDLKTRRGGGQRFIELHLEIPRTTSFQDAHDLMVEVLRAIERELPRSKVFVHGDPV